VGPYTAAEGTYFVVVAARSIAALPPPAPNISLFTDAEDSELKRGENNAREVLRLDALLKERNAVTGRQIAQLEALAAERERAVGELSRRLIELNDVREQQFAERTRALVALQQQLGESSRALAAQERIIAYQQSFRGWITQPWRRVRRWRERAR
jgi:chromosome segregation ATPase